MGLRSKVPRLRLFTKEVTVQDLKPGPSDPKHHCGKGIQPTPPSSGIGCSGICPNTSLKNPVGFTSSSAVCGVTPQRRAQAKGDRESLWTEMGTLAGRGAREQSLRTRLGVAPEPHRGV